MSPKASVKKLNIDSDLNKRGLPLWAYNLFLIFSCLVGLGLSLYAYTVELMMEQDKNFKPLCDINSHISCTKVFGSQYGKGFGIFETGSFLHQPNSFFGIVFYSMVATLSLSNSLVAVYGSLILIKLSNIASLYFAYILYFILADLCVVCIATYIVNVMNLVLIMNKFKKVGLIQTYDVRKNESKKKAQ